MPPNHPKELLALGIREYRETFFKPYRIIYRVIDDKAYVYLIADGRRDMVEFISSKTLLEQRKAGRTANEIALNVMAYVFHHPEIVRFFASQFRQHFASGTRNRKAIRHARTTHNY